MQVVKRNRRLVVVDDEGVLVYCPPDWIRNRMAGRSDLQRLVNRVADGARLIDEIIALETARNPKVTERTIADIQRRFARTLAALGND